MLSCEGAAVMMADRERRRGQRWPIIVLTGIVSAVLSPGAGAQIKQKEGSDVTLKAEYKGVPSEISWKKDGNKVVEMELFPNLKTHFYRIGDRANISPTDGSLIIRNLRVEDSGLYKAEAMVENSIIEDTFISLTVIACPTKPTISDHSTKDKIELSCESETSGVTYEWRKQTDKVGEGAIYTSNRSREDVTLTCVVYVDKDVCKNETSITVRYIPEPSSSLWWIALIILAVVVLTALIVYYYRKHKCSVVKRCYAGNDQVPEREPLKERFVFSFTIFISCVESVQVQRYTYPIDDMQTIEVKLGKPVKGSLGTIQSLSQTVKETKDKKDLIVEAHLSSKEIQEFLLKDTINFDLSDGKYVTKVVLKGGKLTLEPRSVTIKNLEPKDSGMYRIDVHSAQNIVVRNSFKMKVILKDKKDKREICLKLVKNVTPENEHPEEEPIGNLTLHPTFLTNAAQVTWKKNGEDLAIGDGKTFLHLNKDLTIYKVTSADNGTYTIHCDNQALEEQFYLSFEAGRTSCKGSDVSAV